MDLSPYEFSADDLVVEDALAVLNRTGFVILRGLLREHVEPIMAEVRHAVDLAKGQRDTATRARFGWLTPEGAVFNAKSKEPDPRAPWPKTPDEGSAEDKPQQLIVVPISHRNCPPMLASARDPKLRAIVEGHFKEDAFILGNGQCMYKEAHGGTAMALHQDGVYSPESYEEVLTCYTYLTPTSLDGGCIRLVPHSHEAGLLRTREEYVDDALPAELADWPDTIAIPGEPGDTVIWHWYMVHGSQPNFADHDRPTVLARYGPKREAEMAKEGLKQW